MCGYQLATSAYAVAIADALVQHDYQLHVMFLLLCVVVVPPILVQLHMRMRALLPPSEFNACNQQLFFIVFCRASVLATCINTIAVMVACQ
jgi:ABC-type enterochelin transport system permease subunit